MEKENLPITHSLSVSAPPIEPSGDFQKKSKYATFGGIGARDPSTVAREYLGNVLRDHIPRNIVDLPRLPASTLSSLVAGPTTNSSDIINVPETLAHRPPYPIEVRHPTQSVRDTVIRRNQLRGHGPDSFNNFMEERLIRFTPSISQNNVEDTMTGRHAYQLQEDVGSVIGPSKTWYNSIFRVQSEKLTRQQGSDEDTTAQTERAKDPYHIEENFEEFSVQKILSEFQLKRPVKPSKAKETNGKRPLFTNNFITILTNRPRHRGCRLPWCSYSGASWYQHPYCECPYLQCFTYNLERYPGTTSRRDFSPNHTIGSTRQSRAHWLERIRRDS